MMMLNGKVLSNNEHVNNNRNKVGQPPTHQQDNIDENRSIQTLVPLLDKYRSFINKFVFNCNCRCNLVFQPEYNELEREYKIFMSESNCRLLLQPQVSSGNYVLSQPIVTNQLQTNSQCTSTTTLDELNKQGFLSILSSENVNSVNNLEPKDSTNTNILNEHAVTISQNNQIITANLNDLLKSNHIQLSALNANDLNLNSTFQTIKLDTIQTKQLPVTLLSRESTITNISSQNNQKNGEFQQYQHSSNSGSFREAENDTTIVKILEQHPQHHQQQAVNIPSPQLIKLSNLTNENQNLILHDPGNNQQTAGTIEFSPLHQTSGNAVSTFSNENKQSNQTLTVIQNLQNNQQTRNFLLTSGTIQSVPQPGTTSSNNNNNNNNNQTFVVAPHKLKSRLLSSTTIMMNNNINDNGNANQNTKIISSLVTPNTNDVESRESTNIANSLTNNQGISANIDGFFNNNNTEKNSNIVSVNNDKHLAIEPDITIISHESPEINNSSVYKNVFHKCNYSGCEYTTPTKENLTNHLRNIHNEARPYKCTYPGCIAAFKEKYKLKVHNVVHTGEKPFVCDWPGCASRFSQSGHLSRHRKRHTVSQKFQCSWPDCTRAFMQKHTLKYHLMHHSGDKPWQCNVNGCNRSFIERWKLTKHLRKKHQLIDNCRIVETGFNLTSDSANIQKIKKITN